MKNEDHLGGVGLMDQSQTDTNSMAMPSLTLDVTHPQLAGGGLGFCEHAALVKPKDQQQETQLVRRNIGDWQGLVVSKIKGT